MIEQLESLLIATARERRMLTYAEVAADLDLQPPHIIYQVSKLIEAMMRRHAAAKVPQLASLVVSKARMGMPARGFFLLLEELDLYDGPPEGERARQFHRQELARCFDNL